MKREQKEQFLRDQLSFLFCAGDVFEVCLIGSPVAKHPVWGNEFGRGIIAGWYADIEKAVADIMTVEELVKPTGVYLTINPCNKQMLAVSNERLKPVKARTSDKFIERIENFFIDIDPIRPTGTSSSVDQLSFALDKALTVIDYLPEKENCMFALSGNGYHLNYKAGGISTDEIKKLIAHVSDKFSDDKVGIDTVVFNPARLVKAYGTTARKGEEVKELGIEHRVAVIKEINNVVF